MQNTASKNHLRYPITYRGSVLVFSLIILSLILISALGLANITLTQQRTTNTTAKSTAAFQNADKGVEIFLQTIYHESSVFDTMDDLVSGGRLDAFKCDADGHLVIDGPGNGEFEVIIFKKPDPGSTNDPEVTNDCSTQLGDVARFKIIGERSGSARALIATLNSSLERDLVGHWNFEDNADAVRIYTLSGAGSPVVRDASAKNNHILTLCPLDEDPHGTQIPTDVCPQIVEGANVLIDALATEASNDDIDDYYFDHDNIDWTDKVAWDDGVVDSSGSGTVHTQALAFNGTSNYLAINTTNVTVPNHRILTPPDNYYVSQNEPDAQVSGVTAGNYVDDVDKLSPNDALAISLWVKRYSQDSGIIVRNGTVRDSGSKRGYTLFFEDGDLRFRVQNATVRTSFPTDGEWHHVVAQWDRSSSHGVRKPRLYIDGRQKAEGSTKTSAIEYDSNIPFTIGGMYTNGDSDITFDITKFGNNDGSEPVESGLHGVIDGLRIYERALVEGEIKELCFQAKSDWLSPTPPVSPARCT